LSLLVVGAIYFTSCKKTNEGLVEENAVDKMQLQVPQGRMIVLSQLVPYLDGQLTNHTVISQLHDSEAIEYSYVNPDEDSTKIFYFTSESNFKDFIAGSYFESEILNSIRQMDSLQNTGDPNDTTEYTNYLKHKNNEFTVNRRFHVGGKVGHMDYLFDGQTAYYYGPRRNLGSLNKKISSVQNYGPGISAWCWGINWGRPRTIYASTILIRASLMGHPSDDQYQSHF